MDILKSLGLILSVLVALATGVLLIGGGGDGRWEHEGVMQVEARRELVHEWLTDPVKRQRWVTGLVDCKADPPGWLREGTRLLETIEIDGQRRTRTLEVTEIEDGVGFAYHTWDEGVEIEMRYEVGVLFTGGKSRIRYTCSAQYPGWLAKVIEPILGHQRLSAMQEDFDRLARMVEAGN